MRILVLSLASALLGLTVDIGAASAQQADRVYKIGILNTGAPNWVPPPVEKWTGPVAVFRDALRDRGYVAGKNLIVDHRHAEGDVARLAAVAESLVAAKVDVIVSPGTAPTVAAMKATRTVPIVFSGLGAPVEKGIVASLAKPGGNVTGTAAAIGNPKLWQLLQDVAPATRYAGLLVYGPNTFRTANASEYRADLLSRYGALAAAVGVALVDLTVDTRDELEPKLVELASRGKAAIYIITDPVLFSWHASIIDMASRHRLPTVCAQWLGWGQAGCVVTYGEDPSDLNRSIAGQVDKVLKGVKPADIPVEQPSKFKLILNLKTAKALDLTVPPSVLALADQVIE